jgi:multiple sugar transport system permease protein
MNIRKINLRYSKWAIIIAFITLPLFLLFTFTYLPFGEMVTYSFYKMKYIGERTFVGLKNYKDLFTRDDIFNSLKLSL